MPRIATQNTNASLYFNGTAKMTVPVVPDPTGWCFAMWIKPGDKGSPTHTYVSYNSVAFTDGIFISKNAGSGNININVYNGAGAVYGNTLVAPASQWIHIAITYLPNGTCKTYKNGVLLSSATSSGTMTAAAAQLLTFNSRSFTNYFAQSTMSNIVWQNTATSWTDDQVRDIYQTNKLPAGTTMYLALGEGAGSIAYDTSGNANNGTITSPTWTRDTPSKTRKAVNGNLVFNGDFEIAPVVNVAQTGADSNWIDGTSSGSLTNNTFGWRRFNYTGSQQIYLDSTEKYSGQYSLKLSTLGTGATVGVTNSTASAIDPFTNIPCRPSTSYTLTYWMKTNVVSGSATTGAYIRLVGGNVTDSTKVKTTTDWTQYIISVTTTSTTAVLSLEFRITGNDGAATLIMDAWFDDITLTPTTATTRTANTFPQRKTPDNLLSNGNFEYAPPFTAATNTTSRWIDGTAGGSGASQSPYTWGLFGASLSTSAQFDTAQTKTGQYSLKLSTLSANRICTVAPQIAVTNQGIPPALPSTTYSYSFWMKTNKTSGDSAGAYIDFLERVGSGSAGASHLSTQVNTTTDWTYYSGSFTTTANCRFITPKLFVEGNTGTATLIMDAWFDDITLTKVPANARTVVS
jgi:hypothetical protein